jgi:hypothetical protein
MTRIRQEEKEAPRYVYRGKAVPSVTEILSGVGLYPDYSRMNSVEEKRNIGTDGHAYIATRFLDKPRVRKRIRNNASDRLIRYLDVFDYWFDSYVQDFEVICCERQLFYHTIFAGTPDFFGLLKLKNCQPKWTLSDWKFRDKTEVADRMQTAAYKFMACRTFKEEFNGSVERFTVLIPENKVAPHRVVHENDEDDWMDFQAAARVFNLRKKYKLL